MVESIASEFVTSQLTPSVVRTQAIARAREIRNELVAKLRASGGEDGVLIVPSARTFIRNNDVEHEYRQDSDFYALTGFREPQSILVVDLKEKSVVLFVRPRDPEREVWDGARTGIEGAQRVYGANRALPIAEFEKELPKLLENRRRVYFRFGHAPQFDAKVIECLSRGRMRSRFPEYFPSEVFDPSAPLAEIRLRKGPPEVALMRRAAEITAEAHVRAMAACKPGMYEHQIEAVLLETFRKHGAERAAYSSIVGSGPNATVLHYRDNDRQMNDGELLLIDAGAEFGYFASDVTRTFPVNGRFSPEQRAIYELVLTAQLASIEATKPGATIDQIHQASVRVLAEGLVKLGIVSGSVDDVIAKESYKPFYMHRTSHWLGMDVHDVGSYFEKGEPRKLEPGMVLTVEPGLYITTDNPSVEAKWRGIGVRIEDDILVTEKGHENLTRAIPKTVQEVETACRG